MIKEGQEDEEGCCSMILRWIENMLQQIGWQKTEEHEKPMLCMDLLNSRIFMIMNIGIKVVLYFTQLFYISN